MTILLFPGRHLLNTAFQERYLRGLLQMPLDRLQFLDGRAPAAADPLDQIVFAVTSCNQQNSRYNPIPFHARAVGVDRFARPLEMTFGIRYRIIGIPHYPPTPRFARHVLREIEEQTEGALCLAPDNCVVLCAAPALIAMYQALGFAILPGELTTPGELTAPGGLAAPDNRVETPIELLKKVVAVGEGWATNPELRQKLSPATFDLWQDFPDVPRRILRLWRDPLLTDNGDLTESRDYAAYAYGMGNREIIELKYRDVKEAIVPGKIVDEGCADGALLALIARDFPDSDLIGIEITGEFIARCRERQRAGDFGGSFVFFHQRNITQPIFEANSVDCTLCNATLHELWSYGDRAETLHAYFGMKYEQTAANGRLIIRDVTGPEDKEREVYLWLNDADGANEAFFAEFDDPKLLQAHLAGLSTYGRFRRFARDFLADMRRKGLREADTAVQFREEIVGGVRYVALSLRQAAEFISKKDYTDNWASEMNEEFAFWGFSDWKKALSQAGFTVVENPNLPASGSRAYTNPWIVTNRYEGKVALLAMVDGRLRPLDYPETNVVLVGEKRP
jgi:trans-aconitate methyltransferase